MSAPAHAADLGKPQVLESSEASPLNALTPYGKRSFLKRLRWRDNQVVGFGTLPLIRELNAEQLSAVLASIDAAGYLPLLSRELAGPPLRLPEPSADVERRLDELQQFAALEAERRGSSESSATTLGAPQLARRYGELFGDRMTRAALALQAPGDLPLLFDAAARAEEGNPGSPALADMLLVRQELIARGIDTRRSIDGSILTALIAAREFDQARAFAAAKPDLARHTIPKVVDPLGPGFVGRSVFAYDAANNTLTRKAVPDAAGTGLLMVVGAGCHFSRDALQAIAQDAEFRASLQKAHLMVVVPPGAAISFDFVASWNAAHPSIPIHIPYSVKEWQTFDVAEVPAFFRLKNGEKAAPPLSGWPAGGNQAALLDYIRPPKQ